MVCFLVVSFLVLVLVLVLVVFERRMILIPNIRNTGKFVSESKFRSNPAAFIPHIESRNTAALDALITKPAVERALLTRLGKKASIYGPEISLSSGGGEAQQGEKWKIDVESVNELYESWIIPLTKEVEVRFRFAEHSRERLAVGVLGVTLTLI